MNFLFLKIFSDLPGLNPRFLVVLYVPICVALINAVLHSILLFGCYVETDVGRSVCLYLQTQTKTKIQSRGDDSAKKFKTETGIAFVPAPPGMIPMMPVMHGHPGSMPIHVMPTQFMPPGVMPVPPNAPPGIGVMPPAPMAPPPERPLYSSGIRHDAHLYSAADAKPGPPPLFPSGVLSALDQSKESSKQPSNRTSVGYSVSISDTVKLMHPDNEISMEELRASLPKYAPHHPPILPPQPLHMHPPPPDPMGKGEFQSGPMFYPTHPTIRPPDFPPPHFEGHRMQNPYKHY